MTASPRRRRIVLISLGAIVLALVAAAAWVGFRALTARDSLEAAAATAKTIPDMVGEGDSASIEAAAAQFASETRAARDATGDPLWRIAELVPWLGGNLTAVREISEVADELAADAVTPLAGVAGDLDPGSLGFADGRIDIAPLVQAAPILEQANAAFQRAVERVEAIQTPSIPLVADALEQLRDATISAAATVDTLDRAAAVLPSMLSTDGPRTYLLLMLNNAELRTYGGIPGALAVLRAEDGHVTITDQRAASDITAPKTPAIELSDSTIALFDTLPGRFMQNTASAIDFEEAGAAAAALWQQTTGESVDGVIAIDTVSLGYLLEATGPVQAGPFTLDADNAVETLLSTAYSDIEDTGERDAAFASVASGIFNALIDGDASAVGVLSALDRSADEHRLHVWSTHPDEQEILRGTTLSTILLPDDSTHRRVGVFFNDVTSSKLDYYATPVVSVSETCGENARVRVTVDWSNTIPGDAATSLPRYVTGSGLTDTPIGDTLTRVTVVGPTGWLAQDYSIDGSREGVQTALFEDRTAVQHEFVTTPGGSHRVVVEFVPPADGTPSTGALDVVTTPTVQSSIVEKVSAKCGS